MANKGGTLANLGQALSGYGSALSGNPMYLQNSLLLRQAQQQQQQQEQAQRQEQVSNIASRSLMRGGPMTDENKAGLLRLAAPQAFNSALAQQAMQQLFPAKPTAQVLKPGETLGLTSADGKFTPTYTAPSEPKPLSPEIQVALWATGGDEQKARQMVLDARRQKGPEAPSGYRYAPDGSELQPIPGGPADIGQKGLPQAYKEAKAGIKTLRGSVQNFRDKFMGTPEKIDPVTGKKIPAVSGTGTEIGGADAGTLDNLHTQILLGTKTAEALGALDKGSIDVAERMVRNPTGLFSPFQLNSYTESQIAGYLKYLDDKEKNLDESYQAGTWRPPSQSGSQIPAGISPQEWSAMTPEERALFQ